MDDDALMLDETGDKVSPEILRYRELMTEARLASGEVWYEGRGGPLKLYHYRFDDRTIRVTHIEGWLFMCCATAACTVMGAIIGLISYQGDGNFDPPYTMTWVLALICCCFGFCFGVLMGFKRVTNTMELRLVQDITLEKTFIQNRRKDGTARLYIYTLDPTTPVLKAKVPVAERIYERMIQYLYRRDRGPDAVWPPPNQFEKNYGIKLPPHFCGFYGLLPTRTYQFRDWDITVENRNCCKMRRDHIRRESIYDISLRYNCAQLLLKKCLRDRANMHVYTMDMSAGHVKLRLRDAEQEFDNLRKEVDAMRASDLWWQRTRLAGFMMA